MPVYNEIRTIEEILGTVRAVPFEKEVVVVDDASTDGTREWLAAQNHPAVKVVLRERNGGKGAAVRDGIGHASGDIIVIQDPDLEYHPADYPRLVGPIVSGKADVVYG